MGRTLLFILIFVTGICLFLAPWITGLAYVSNSLLQPQYIWHWIFEGIPIFKITAGIAIAGFLVYWAQGNVNFQVYKNTQNKFLVVIWVWMHLSQYFSSFKGVTVSVPPALVLDILDSIMIMYFIILGLCQKEIALKYLCYAFILVGLYYTYWANSAYLNQEWYRFVNDRLVGPSGSPYHDENVMSTLIVMCVPFIIFMYFRVKHKLLKVLIVAMVPLAWHAIILFSSRTALLASVVSLLAIAFVIRSSKVNISLGVFFTLFMAYQGAMLLERTSETIERSKSYSVEPVNPRLVSWEVGLKLIPIYPVFGAGVQMYEAAAATHFPGKTPNVAHNTFLNFAVNAGLLTGLMFLGLIWLAWSRLKEARRWGGSFQDLDYYALVSSSTSLIGFFVCSMFLDLIIFEPFYIVLIINLVSYLRVSEKFTKTSVKGHIDKLI